MQTRRLQTLVGLSAIVTTALFAPTSVTHAQIEGATIYANESASVAPWDRIGNAVGLSGTTAIVGAHWEGSTGLTSFGPGAAYIFENGSQTAKLIAPARNNGDLFGESVAIDGDVAVVGAPSDSFASIASGVAYVFRRVGGVWGATPVPRVSTSRDSDDRFGCAVAIQANRIVVGADEFHTLGGGTGKAFVFEFDGTNWIQTASLHLLTVGLDSQDKFGSSVALDGNTIIVGAIGDDGASNAMLESGAAYVFGFDGTNWSQQDILRASAPTASARLGFSVAISNDTAAIGARDDAGTGAVHIAERTGSAWIAPVRKVSQATGAGDQLGFSVAIDGDMVVAGAPAGFGNAGYVAILQRSGSSWIENDCSPVVPSFGGQLDQFGAGVALDGTTLLGGAPGNDDVAQEAGSATFYEIVPLGDSDGDGMSDGLEVCAAFGGNCPNRMDPDSDDDGLTDGEETFTYGSSPCATDSDGDTLADNVEVAMGTSPTSIDTDSDGSQDNIDNCPTIANPAQANFDADAQGDACDPDDDNDGLSDANEATYGSNPFDIDSDDDSLGDGVEFGLGTNPNSSDTDGDGLSDAVEAADSECPHPTVADSDGDGLNDGMEQNSSFDPCDSDMDGDMLSDGAEVNTHSTDPNDADSDDDNLSDGAEIGMGGGAGACPDPNDSDSDNDGVPDGNEMVGTCGPCDSDTDSDGLCNSAETTAGTNPADPDSDDDGLLDGAEIAMGCTNPLAGDSDGDTLSDGSETASGTSPCSNDTDGDTLPDNTDPFPLIPGVTPTILANLTFATAGEVLDTSTSLFIGPNNSVRQARRAILTAQLALAAVAINNGNYNAAQALLTLANARVDGMSSPSDWMVADNLGQPTPAKAQIHSDIQNLLTLLDLIN